MKRKWYPNKIKEIQKLAEQDYCLSEISQQMQEPKASIWNIAKINNIKIKPKNGWSKNEIQQLRQCIKINMKLPEIAKTITTKSKCGIKKYIIKHFAEYYGQQRQTSVWNDKEIEKLKILRKNHYNYIDISIQLNKSIESIKYKCNQLKLENPKFWDKQQDQILIEKFQKQENISFISKFFNRKESAIYNRLHRLGLTTRKGNLKKEAIKFSESNENKKLCTIINNRFKSAQKRAKEKKLEFNINRQFLYNLFYQQRGKCFYSGINMIYDKKDKGINKNLYSVSVDRIDSSNGYVENNIVLCCTIVNRMKHVLSIEQLKTMCSKILETIK